MSWTSDAKKALANGETVQVWPTGYSMAPLIKSGDPVTLEPVADHTHLKKGDIVLARVKGNDYLHLIKAIRPGLRFQIGNNRGGVKGWTGAAQVFGLFVSRELRQARAAEQAQGVGRLDRCLGLLLDLWSTTRADALIPAIETVGARLARGHDSAHHAARGHQPARAL